MYSIHKTWSALAVLSAILLQPSTAQIPQLPGGVTPEQALRLAQNDPQAAQIVIQRLRESGLTPEQIRAQLRAAGLRSNILDAFLADADTTVEINDPSQEAIRALSVLGLGSFTARDSLILSGDSLALRLFRDSIRADSITIAETEKQPLRLFGLDVFRQATTQFQPIVAGPVGPNYPLGPGDQLVLILTGEIELSRTLEVTREGFIVLPDVGQISVANLTLDQLRSVLRTRLGRVYSGIQRGATFFDLTVSRVRTVTIRVAGEVAIPGSATVSATASVLQALYDSGGLTQLSNFRDIRVMRGPNLIGSLDLYDFLLTGALQSEIRLQDGDVVFVPIRGPRVSIAGEVHRPAIYELAPAETLRDLVAAAGGLRATARVDNASITRIVPPHQRVPGGSARTVQCVNIGAVVDPATAPFELRDGDSITIASIRGQTQSVAVEGSVWQPGRYELRSGMTLADLLRDAGGMRPETFSGRIQILRMRPDSTRFLIGAVAPQDGSPPFGGNNPILQDRDSVRVFSRTEFRPERQIGVFGAVQTPGFVPYTDSMTLRDALLLAGGIDDNAYLLEAEVSRPQTDPVRSTDTVAIIYKTPLDSSYVFDLTAQFRRPTGNAGAVDFLLEAYDHVFIRHQPGLELQRNVIVTGEVLLPGAYTLMSRQERLSDLLSRAGGLTGEAYPNGISFFRRTGSAGRINVDLDEILDNPRHRDNLILANGDSIHIPEFIPTVRVEGEVLSPTSVAYVPGARTSDYVNSAGGFTRLADKRRTFVQQPNGLIEKRTERPEPGAVVVVPGKDPDDRGIPFAALVGGVSQLLAALTTIIILLDRS